MKRLSLYLLCMTLALAACTAPKANQPILDLTTLPQDAQTFHGLEPDIPLLSPEQQQTAFTNLLTQFFDPWERTQPKFTAKDVFWGFAYYGPKKLYGENTLLRSPEWMDQLREDSRIEHYPSMNRKAITVTNTNMRVLPTHQPAFKDFKKAGEGFPFDYMQNTLILAGTPLYATHISADRAWILVESCYVYGWVPSRDIGWVNDDFISTFKTGTYGAIVRDDIPVTDGDGNYRFTGHIGTLLPVKAGGFKDNGTILIIPTRALNGDAVAQTAFLPNSEMQKAPLPATPANFSKLLNEMLNRPYGWAGLYEGRDCTSTTMDLMTTFGIDLPRHSSLQIEVGTHASLKGLTREEKKRFIINSATPFLTLIGKSGHIMLYIGQKDGQPVIFHATWGLKTRTNKGYGRKVIGRAVITTLEPGLELPNLAKPEGILLEKINAISTLP